MWVLDTNTVIYFFKDGGNVATRLFQHSPKDLALPAVVLFELQVGIAKSLNPSKRQGQLETLVSSISVLPFGQPEAHAASEIRADLESQGTPIGPFDTLIAGTALAYGATLVTRNIKEFKRVKALKLEDWYS